MSDLRTSQQVINDLRISQQVNNALRASQQVAPTYTSAYTALSPSVRLAGLGISNYTGTDLAHLYATYPTLYSSDEQIKQVKADLHNNLVAENIDVRAHNANLIKEIELLKLDGYKAQDLQNHVKLLIDENQATINALREKTRECDAWRLKFAEIDESAHRANVMSNVISKENAHLTQEQINAKDQLARFESLKVHHAHLQAELNAANLTKERLVALNAERDAAAANAIQERERIIAEQNTKLGLQATQMTDYESLKLKISMILKENERLSHVVGENIKTIDAMKFRITQLNEVENQLGRTATEKSQLSTKFTEVQAENDSLRASNDRLKSIEAQCRALQADKDQLINILNDKMKQLDTQRAQITGLEQEVARVPELHSKIGLLSAENERLNVVLVEKIRTIDEWQLRYQSLEQLYLNIKDTTEQLDFVKKKYESVVVASEKADPSLKQSMQLRYASGLTQ